MKTKSTPQVFVIKIPELDPATGSHEEFLSRSEGFWKNAFNQLPKEGSLWVISTNLRYNGELIPFPLLLCGCIQKNTKFKLRNLLIWYKLQKPPHDKPFLPAYEIVLFFVKSLKDYYFNKDAVKVPHVFKDIEWGKRTVGISGYSEREKLRYGPKGRDSGNVLYVDQRNSEGRILDICEYPEEKLYEFIIKLSSKKGRILGTNIRTKAIGNVCKRTGRNILYMEV